MLMKNITEDLNSTVLAELGIEVVDVRVKKIDLPDEVSNQVYRRMTAERNKEAQELRSTGKERAEKIRASADRERTIELANAYRDAEKIRGEELIYSTGAIAGAATGSAATGAGAA